jgi:hypothetical protein
MLPSSPNIYDLIHSSEVQVGGRGPEWMSSCSLVPDLSVGWRINPAGFFEVTGKFVSAQDHTQRGKGRGIGQTIQER